MVLYLSSLPTTWSSNLAGNQFMPATTRTSSQGTLWAVVQQGGCMSDIIIFDADAQQVEAIEVDYDGT